MKLLVRGGRLVTEDGVYESDLLAAGGRIERIAPSIPLPSGCREINASGMIVMPGVIDPHVHLDLNAYGYTSSDDFFSGTGSAAAGGVTTLIDFAIPSPGQSMKEAFKEKLRRAESAALVDFSFHAQLTGSEGASLPDMEEVLEEGVRSFKIFMPSTEGWGMDDYLLYRALEKASSLNSLVMVHAETGSLVSGFTESLISAGRVSIKDYPGSRPGFAEKTAVLRAALLAAEAGAPLYLCHLSAGSSAAEIRRLKRTGLNILAETCPQYLVLNENIYGDEEGYLAACAPPLRKEADSFELWRGIIENTIDTAGTDHCPFLRSQKKAGGGSFLKTPMGLPGVETLFSVMYTEGVEKRGISIESLYRLISLNPARIFGLYPRKGTLKEGSDADLHIFSEEQGFQIRGSELKTACDWTPFEGMESVARTRYTVSRGEIVYENGVLKGEKGRGVFLSRGEPDLRYF